MEETLTNSNTKLPFDSTNNYNFTDFGHGHTSWDGNTHTSIITYPPSYEVLDKKMDDVLKRMAVIERTLLAILNSIESLETKSDAKQV